MQLFTPRLYVLHVKVSSSWLFQPWNLVLDIFLFQWNLTLVRVRGRREKTLTAHSLLNSEILDSFFAWMDGDLFLWDFFF